MLFERRDEAAATAFFAKVIASNGWPDKVVIDKSGSNAAGLFNMNCLLVMHNWCWLIEVLQVKYLNSIIASSKELRAPCKLSNRSIQPQRHWPAPRHQSIEVAHMIRKGQFDQTGLSGFSQFANLAG